MTGVDIGLVVGPPEAADLVARRVQTHPEARLHLVGYLGLPTEEPEAVTTLPRLGTVEDLFRVAHEHEVERVVVTEAAR